MGKEVPDRFRGRPNSDTESGFVAYSHWRTYAVSDCSSCKCEYTVTVTVTEAIVLRPY